jgi:hypothetical protein
VNSKLLFFVFLLVCVYFANNYLSSYLPANTYLGSKNLGYKSKKWLMTYLAKHKNPKLKIKVKNRVYQLSYEDLGVVFDLNSTYDKLVAETKLPLYQKMINFWKSFRSSRTVLPAIIFTQDYYDKVANLRFNFSKAEDQIKVDKRKKSLVYENYQDIFIINDNSLAKEIVSNFGQKKVLEPKLERVFNSEKKIKMDAYNRQIAQILEKPVYLYYRNEKQEKTVLSEKVLQKLLEIKYDQESEQLSVGVNKVELANQLSVFNRQINLSSDLQFDQKHFKESLTALILTRFDGNQSDYISVRLVNKPNTDGTKANKYIEIDLSQQNMYLWENGENMAVYRISSGLYYPTPPGKYQILNKAPNAYSEIYHVWMPFWMAFSLDPKVNAYLGIHELPYYYDITGTEIRRPRDFIGSPHTGGCVSLDVGEARQVYDWAEVGTLVMIFE